MYWDANNLYRWAMSPKLPADCFKWEKNISKFDENFIKDYDIKQNQKNDFERLFEATKQCSLRKNYGK